MNKLDGKVVLITGGTGSLGQSLVKRLLSSYDTERIVIFSRDELKQSDMRQKFPSKKLEFIIGDVRDYNSVYSSLQNTNIVIHAAALKQVGTCEKFPDEAIFTNYMGASNIVRAIKNMSSPPEIVIGVSSDKGCHPTNVYGASKFLQEKRFMLANYECPTTRFSCVLYGNVMGSRGSVIPKWLEQIKNKEMITITSYSMTRFLISLDQAVDTLISAIEKGQREEVWIPRIPSARIGDIADILMGPGYPFRITGRGDGEKMNEVLITEEEAPRVMVDGDYYVVTTTKQKEPALNGEYNSKDYLISIEKLRNLLHEQGFI